MSPTPVRPRRRLRHATAARPRFARRNNTPHVPMPPSTTAPNVNTSASVASPAARSGRPPNRVVLTALTSRQFGGAAPHHRMNEQIPTPAQIARKLTSRRATLRRTGARQRFREKGVQPQRPGRLAAERGYATFITTSTSPPPATAAKRMQKAQALVVAATPSRSVPRPPVRCQQGAGPEAFRKDAARRVREHTADHRHEQSPSLRR
jgi:hypothetical protein